MGQARYPLGDLHDLVRRVLMSYDVPDGDARVTASRMLEADLRGMDGHGIFRLPAYAERLERGGYNTAPQMTLAADGPCTAIVDGDNGLGQVVVTRAVETAVAKARDTGLAWVGTRNSNHAGAGGVYAALALEHDMIGIYMAIGSANHMPPWGGSDMLLSTNPLAIAVPGGEEPPVVVDMATTVASYGRIKVAADRGEAIPEGWMVDRSGQPLTDPTRSHEGFLVPIGGPKGYGLNLAIGALAGVLNGAAFGSEVVDFNADFETPPNTGQAIITARVDAFRPVADFKEAMDARLRELKSSAVLPGFEEIRIPGDRAPGRAAEYAERGVPVTGATAERLSALADRRGITDHPFAAAP